MTELCNEYLNKISQYLVAQNDQSNIHQNFQCLIVYCKIISNYSSEQTISISIQEPIQENLLRCGLLSKRGGCLQITSRIHERCFDTDWVKQQLSENSIFQQILYWAEEDKFLEDKLCDLILVEKSNIGGSVKGWVNGCLVKSQLIKGWENGDDVYHQDWRTIRNNILNSDERNRRLILELYTNILQKIPVTAKKEYEVLLRLGLIVENVENGNLKIAKNIYQLVFSQTWVQTELDQLPQLPSTPEPPTTEPPTTEPPTLLWWSELKNKISRLFGKVKLYFILSLLVCLLIIVYHQQTLEDKGLTAKNQFDEVDKQLSSLVLATEYGQELKNLNIFAETVYKTIKPLFPLQYILKNIYQKDLNIFTETAYKTINPLFPLQYILENIYQKNEFNEFKKGNEPVTSLGFIQDSQDALILVASGYYGSIRLWNLSDPSKKRLIADVKQGTITSISCNAKYKFFATSGTNGTIKFWDTSTSGKPIYELKLMDSNPVKITSIKFSPNGNILAAVLLSEKGQYSVKLWKVSEGKTKLTKLYNLPVPDAQKKVEAVSFNVDETLIATAEEGGTVRLWDISGNKSEPILKSDIKDRQGGITSVNFSPADVNLIVTAGKNGTVMLWDLDGKPKSSPLEFEEKKKRGKLFSPESNVNFSPNQKFIAITGKTEKVQLWKLQDLQNKDNKVDDYPFKAHNDQVSRIIFSPLVKDKYYLATSGSGIDKTVRLWDLSKREKEPYFKKEGLKMIGIGKASDGMQRLLIKENDSVELFELLDDSPLPIDFQISGNSIKSIKAKSVDISPDKKNFITVDDTLEVKLWNFSGELQKTKQMPIKRKVRNIILSSDAYYPFPEPFVIIEEGNKANIWNFSEHNASLGNSSNLFNNAIFHPKYEIIATMDGTEKVKFWNVQGEPIKSNLDSISSSIKSMKFSPNGKFLAVVGENQTINLWEISTQEKENRIYINVKNKWPQSIDIDKVTMVEFSYDGELIATSGDDNLVKVWDLKGRQVAEFSGDWHKTVSLSFNLDSTKIFAAGDNGKVYDWEIKDLDALLKESCLWLKDDYLKFHPDQKEKLCP